MYFALEHFPFNIDALVLAYAVEVHPTPIYSISESKTLASRSGLQAESPGEISTRITTSEMQRRLSVFQVVVRAEIPFTILPPSRLPIQPVGCLPFFGDRSRCWKQTENEHYPIPGDGIAAASVRPPGGPPSCFEDAA